MNKKACSVARQACFPSRGHILVMVFRFDIIFIVLKGFCLTKYEESEV